jgi:putative flippase GtrA
MAEFARIARFIAVGLLNTLFGYAIYALFLFFSFPLWLTLLVSIIAGFTFNFLTYGGLVFKDLSRQNLPRFLLFYLAFAVVNYTALKLLEASGVKPILGQAMLLPLLAAICYAGLRLFVFRATEYDEY